MRVLIVEDNITTANYLSQGLAMKGLLLPYY